MREWIVPDEDIGADGAYFGYQELLRCKDCKYCRTYYHGENMPFSYACDKLYLTSITSSDDYCSRAMRKDV